MATAGSTSSSHVDTDTPQGADSNHAQFEYQWSEEEILILKAWKKYACDLNQILCDLRRYGPGSGLPCKRRADIRKLLTAEAKILWSYPLFGSLGLPFFGSVQA